MPVRSTIKRLLPPELLEELNTKLIANDFSDYDGIVAWANQQLRALDEGSDARISRSALGRHAAHFERKLEAVKQCTEQARALVAADPDSQGAVSDAVVRLIHNQLFNALVDAQESIQAGDLAKLARAVSSLGRVTIRQRQWSEEVRARLERQKLAAGETIGRIARSGGLSDDAERAMRAALFSINPLEMR